MDRLIWMLIFKLYGSALKYVVLPFFCFRVMKSLYTQAPLIFWGLCSLVALFFWLRHKRPFRRNTKNLAQFEKSVSHLDPRAKGFAFEEYIKRIYSSSGRIVETAQTLRAKGAVIEGYDQGLDLIISDGRLLAGLQLKYSDKKTLDKKGIEEIVTAKALYNFHEGIVITNRHFSKAAIQIAQANGVTLIDREKLEDIISNLSKAA